MSGQRSARGAVARHGRRYLGTISTRYAGRRLRQGVEASKRPAWDAFRRGACYSPRRGRPSTATPQESKERADSRVAPREPRGE